MPRYQVTLSDGRTFEIDANRQPTPEEVLAHVGGGVPKIGTPPTQAELPAPKAPPPTAGATYSEPQEEHTTLETTLGILNTIPRTLAQGLTSGMQVAKGTKSLGQGLKDTALELISPHSRTTGETPLAEAGMPEGWGRTLTGLALEIASPMGLPAKAGTALGLGAKAAKVLANPVGAGLGVAAKGAKMIPGVEAGLDMAAKPFVKYHGLDKFMGASGDRNAQEYFRLLDSELLGADTATRTAVSKILGNVEDADKLAIASFLAKPKKYPLAGRPELVAKADELKQLFGAQFQEEVAQGLMSPKHVAKNYFPQVRTADDNARHLIVDETVATDRHAKKKVYKWDEHLATNRAVDPMTAAQVRLSAGNRALKTSDFLHLMGQEFGQPLVKGTPLPPGFRALNLRNLKVPSAQQEVLKTLAFPKEIAESLEKAQVIMADPTGWRKMLKGVNLAFKTGVTVFNPAHHANNLQGNAYLMYLGGMNPKDIVKGYAGLNNLHALMGDKATPAQLAALRAKVLRPGLTEGEAFDAATKYNLFGSSEAMIDFNRRAKTTSGGHPVADKLKQSADTIRFQTSRFIEDPARWALFKDQLLKGKSPEDAILHVKKYLFDYSELTDFEKGIRDYGLMPFYSWMRKNTALHLGEVGEGSNKLRQAQLAYTAPGKLGDPNNEVTQPAWQKEEGYQPVGAVDDEGNVPLVRLANPGLDINKTTSPVSGMLKSALGPLPSAFIEGATGRDLRTGQQILGTDTGYTTASPLGTLAATLEAKTGIPMPRFGTVPNEDGTGMIQPERLAFAMSQIPLPLLPYAQRIAGSPGETLGSQLNAGPGKILKEILLRSLGLTPRQLTPDQQDAAVEAILKKMFAPEEQHMVKEQGEAMLRGS